MIIACTIFFLLDTHYGKIDGTTLMYSFVSYPFVALLCCVLPLLCVNVLSSYGLVAARSIEGKAGLVSHSHMVAELALSSAINEQR